MRSSDSHSVWIEIMGKVIRQMEVFRVLIFNFLWQFANIICNWVPYTCKSLSMMRSGTSLLVKLSHEAGGSCQCYGYPKLLECQKVGVDGYLTSWLDLLWCLWRRSD